MYLRAAFADLSVFQSAVSFHCFGAVSWLTGVASGLY